MEQARTTTRLMWQRPQRMTVGYGDVMPRPMPLPIAAVPIHAPRRRRRCRQIRAMDALAIAQLSAYYARPTPERLSRDNAAVRLWRRLLSR